MDARLDDDAIGAGVRISKMRALLDNEQELAKILSRFQEREVVKVLETYNVAEMKQCQTRLEAIERNPK